MNRGKYWSWNDVNRFTFHEDIARYFFYIFMPSDLDLLTL